MAMSEFVRELLNRLPLPDGATVCIIGHPCGLAQGAYYDNTFLIPPEEHLRLQLREDEVGFVKEPTHPLNEEEAEALVKAGARDSRSTILPWWR